MAKWKNKSGTKTYYAWRSMVARCHNPKNEAFPNYGGRGIEVCERWRNDYDAFFDDMGECPEGLTLERVDNEKGYEPSNCEWASWFDQGKNRRGNVELTHNGVTMHLSGWARQLGLNVDTLWKRINEYGMPLEIALQPDSLAPKGVCGTRTQYGRGCRCAECRAAHAAYHRAARARRKARREQEEKERKA